MPESMSRERRALMAAYGARLELTPAAAGIDVYKRQQLRGTGTRFDAYTIV